MSIRSRSLELITDPTTGRLSHSRLWSNIGSGAATVVFVQIGWSGTVSGEIFGLFLAGICGHAAVSKLLSLKYGPVPAAGAAEEKAGA